MDGLLDLERLLGRVASGFGRAQRGDGVGEDAGLCPRGRGSSNVFRSARWRELERASIHWKTCTR